MCGVEEDILYGGSATESPLGTICKEKGISSRFQVSFFSRYDLGCIYILFILVLVFKGVGAWAADRKVWYL